ncbi:Clathrin light chain 2 [Sesamum angolense]|uniref:Clathrin light chain n=1 Tax=Sesamum angolense TaxID=2727404 RepID=A0AAE1WN12_9LAMI|nr:Clathrin light chain 2 [Sesamum angolense]
MHGTEIPVGNQMEPPVTTHNIRLQRIQLKHYTCKIVTRFSSPRFLSQRIPLRTFVLYATMYNRNAARTTFITKPRRMQPTPTSIENSFSSTKTKGQSIRVVGGIGRGRIMSSDFTASFGEDSPRLSSQRFDSARFESFPNYAGSELMREAGLEEDSSTYGSGAVDPPPPSEEISEGGDFAVNGPIPPVPAEEAFALREWRRSNAIRLEEKERREKEVLKEIIKEADEHKAEYYRKWKIRCENSRAVNREKEKAIAELIPKEVPTIEKKGKKDKEKKPNIIVIQGPKPGKPTDLSRMRQVLVKLKHKPPGHMLPPPREPKKDAKAQELDQPAASTSMSENQAVSAVAE